MMKLTLNYKTGFFLSTGALMVCAVICISLLLRQKKNAEEDLQFRKEVTAWIETNSAESDSSTIRLMNSSKQISMFPGILSNFSLVNKNETQQPQLDLEHDPKSRNQRKNNYSFQTQSELEKNENKAEEYIESQLNELKYTNLELRNKLDSYGYLQFKTDAGVVVDYVGELKNDQPHGYGTAIFSSGKRYEGNWDFGKKSGEGTYYYKNNERYEGSFVNNVREGEGTYYFSNGDRYIGSWKLDKRDGQGMIIKKNGNTTKNGIWKEDKFVK